MQSATLLAIAQYEQPEGGIYLFRIKTSHGFGELFQVRLAQFQLLLSVVQRQQRGGRLLGGADGALGLGVEFFHFCERATQAYVRHMQHVTQAEVSCSK